MRGLIPTGFWIMDEARSRKLVPASLTLWVLRDDGDQLSWVSVETNKAGHTSVNMFEGRYGGPPTTVQGNGFVVSLTSPGPRLIEVSGEVPGMGPFVEKSEVSEDGRLMIVNGRVETADGVLTWYEEFNWQGPSPHRG
ncbi:MAG: hypothetical protein ABW173_05105 [Sphingomonas sp.]